MAQAWILGPVRSMAFQECLFSRIVCEHEVECLVTTLVSWSWFNCWLASERVSEWETDRKIFFFFKLHPNHNHKGKPLWKPLYVDKTLFFFGWNGITNPTLLYFTHFIYTILFLFLAWKLGRCHPCGYRAALPWPTSRLCAVFWCSSDPGYTFFFFFGSFYLFLEQARPWGCWMFKKKKKN